MRWMLVGLLAQQLAASAPSPTTPTVTTEQRLQAQNLALRIENAQLRLQQAQADGAEWVRTMQRDGYTFDPQTLTYSPKKEAK